MKKLLGTTATIEESRLCCRHRKYWMTVFSFLAIYFMGSFVSSVLLMGPMTYHIFNNPELVKLMESGVQDQQFLVDTVYETMPEWMNAATLISTLGMILVTVFYCKRFENRRPALLGFIKKGAFLEYISGLGIGLLMFSIAFAILYFYPGGEAVIGFGLNKSVSVPMIILYFLGFVVQGASEEIFLRGFFFVSGASSSNVTKSMLISSAVFAFLHLGNGGMNVVAFINLFLCGIFFSLYYLRRGSIWGACAIHSMWNFTQGNIFGFNVSGTDAGSSLFFVEYKNALLSGGEFGPEGGLAVTVVILAAIGILLLMKNKRVSVPPMRVKGEFYSI